MPGGLERREGVARPEIQASGSVFLLGRLAGDRGRPGMPVVFPMWEESLCARPPLNRSPDEALHEVPSD